MKHIKSLATAVALTLALSPIYATAQEDHNEFKTAIELADNDKDGIPDEWEENGFTDEYGNEYPLNQWGADPNKPDLFLQLNWMHPHNGENFAPEKNELINLINIFDKHGYNLHIDAGDIYTSLPTETYTPQGGETINYRPYYIEDETPYELYTQADTYLGNHANIFRSGVIVDNVKRNSRMSGLGLVGGKSFIATKQRAGESTDRVLAHVLLHEFGHTLGLTHSGASDLPSPGAYDPHYPNYYSVMNYLYMYDTLNYSEDPSFDTSELPDKCYQTYLECFTGRYYIPEDWDNLQISNMGFEYTRGKSGTTITPPVRKNDTQKNDVTATVTPTPTTPTTQSPSVENPPHPSNQNVTPQEDTGTNTTHTVKITFERPVSEAKPSKVKDTVSNNPQLTTQAESVKHKVDGHLSNDASFGILIGVLAIISTTLAVAGIGYVLGAN